MQHQKGGAFIDMRGERKGEIYLQSRIRINQLLLFQFQSQCFIFWEVPSRNGNFNIRNTSLGSIVIFRSLTSLENSKQKSPSESNTAPNGWRVVGDMRGERMGKTYNFVQFSISFLVLLEAIIVTIKMSIFCFKWPRVLETWFASMAGFSVRDLFQFLQLLVNF